MKSKRFTAGILFLVVLISPLVLAKETDGPILARIGKVAFQKTKEALPPRVNLTAPLSAFRAGDALPIEERVRLRIETDKQMKGIKVEVWPSDQPNKPGEIHLRGIVPDQASKNRAGLIAQSTIGVELVVNELAIPEIR